MLTHLLPHPKKPLTYRLLTQPQLPPISAAFMEILLAKNGVFARGLRAGLEVAVPVAQVTLPGPLYELQPYLKLEYPRPAPHLLERMLELARHSYDPKTGQPLEILFYLYWEEASGEWRLHHPPQEQTSYSVRPLLNTQLEQEIYRRTLIEVHTHPLGSSYFSTIDNQDERAGFRLFGCLANLFGSGQPQIRMRVGLHSYFWEFEAKKIWDLGSQVVDALTQE
jgi:PRTRC genetic system protein A